MKILQFIAIIFLVTFSSCEQISEKDSQEKFSDKERFKVSNIIDGDTFWTENQNNTRFKVRIIGVDAPETRKSSRKEIGFYGQEAKAYLTDLLKGQEVILVSDVDSLDRYGRTLSYVYLEDGTFVNAKLIENGYASMLTLPPNVKHAALFLKLQKEAREKSLGLWSKEE